MLLTPQELNNSLENSLCDLPKLLYKFWGGYKKKKQLSHQREALFIFPVAVSENPNPNDKIGSLLST